MFKSITAQLIIAVAAAAIAAGLVVFLTSAVPEVRAESLVEDAVHQPHAQDDRLPILVKVTACSARGWPHYEQSCIFDMRRPTNEARTVRIIALR